MIHRAGTHQIVGDNVVFLVKKQHMKFFSGFLDYFGAAIVDHLVLVCHCRFVHDAALPEV